MYRLLLILSMAMIAVFLHTAMFSHANALTTTRYASVRIVDKTSGIWPAHITQQRTDYKQAAARGFLTTSFKREDKESYKHINGEYIVPGLHTNHIQMSLAKLDNDNAPVQFSSMKMLRKAGKEGVMTLATVVNIPSGTAAGFYHPALQISAQYE